MKISWFILCVIFLLKGYAQTGGPKEARKYFESGDFQGCLDIIQSGQFSRKEGSEWLRLKTLCHLYLNDRLAADSAAQQLLEADPTYKDRPHDDPPEMGQLLSKYESLPRMIFGMNTGWNGSFVKVDRSFSTSNSQVIYYPQDGLEKGATFHFQAGLHVQFFAHKKVGVILEPTIVRTSYKKYYQNMAGWESQNFEELQLLECPVWIRYSPTHRKWKPFIQAGINYGRLNSAFGEFSSRQKQGKQVEVVQTYDLIELRKKNQWNLCFSTGLMLRTPRAWFMVDFRYMPALTLMNKPENRYIDARLIFDQQYVDDNFRLNFYRLSLVIAPLLSRSPWGYQAVRIRK